jgi:8-oxo-dGTP pyrophosphatase MutT (NUDIX family)
MPPQLTETEIAARLKAAFNPNISPESPYPSNFLSDLPQPAAVLIPFLRKPDGWHLLFIRRTTHPEDRHGGQVAFPGGRCDAEDPDPESAAKREASEEVGLAPKDIRILGRLRDMLTITNYRVTPVVGSIPWPYELRPQPEEVARIFTISLDWLADPVHHRVEKREIKVLGDAVPVIYFDQYEGELLWGASARITLLLLEALELASPENRYC